MRKLLYVLLTAFCLIAQRASGRPLDEIRRSGVVRVAFTQSGKQTVNLHFAKEFAKFLNCDIKIIDIDWNETFSHNGVVPADYITNDSVRYTPDALLNADIICGTTYMYPWREKFFDFAGIMQVSDLLIVSKVRQRKSVLSSIFVPQELRPKDHKLNVKNYNDLKGLRIAIMENSSYEANLAKINEKIGGGIEIVKTKSEEESQELAKTGEVDGFVTISYVGLQFVNNSSLKSRFKLAFPIASPDNVAWAVEKGNTSLKVEIDNFFHTIKSSGLLDRQFIDKFGFDYASYGNIINSYSSSTINSSASFRDMDEIMESGKLIVALRDRDLVYHPQGQKQLNHYLAGELAKYLRLDLEIKIVPSLSSYFYDSKGNIVKDSAYTPETFNHIDIACDLLSPVDWRDNKIDIMEVMPTADVVIARKDVDIKSISDLSGLRGVTSKGSIYEEDLLENNITNYYYKEANEFFSEIIKGHADYTITNFDIYSLPQYPELEAKFVIGDIYSVGWGIRKNQPKLRQKILEFLESSKKNDIFNNAFLDQAGIPYNAAQNHILAMYQTYQDGYFPFVFYGSDQGLPQEDVRCIFQDKDGYIWIGTQSGAIKFNGRKMEPLSDTMGLSSNIVFDIAQDSKGKMYFATLDGISCMDESGEISTYFSNVPLKHIFIDRKDNKYAYGDKGLYYLSSSNKQQTAMSTKIDGMPTVINSLAQNKSGRCTYLATPDGFYTLERDNNKLTQISSKYCYSVFVEKDGMIWLSASDGVYTGTLSQFSRNIDSLRINDQVSIGNSRIHTIKQNRDESILLISDFEVYQIFSTKQSSIKYDQSIGLKNLKLLCFFEDKENNFWFGFRGGIQKLTNRSLRNLYPEKIDSYLNNIMEDSNGRIWMAFNNKILYYQNHLVDFSDYLDGYKVPYVVAGMPSGDIFIADSYGLYIYDSKTMSRKQELKFSNKIYNLKSAFAASSGDVFLLTGSEGIVYRIPGGCQQPQPIANEHTSLVSQLVEFGGSIVGGNNTGLVKFNGTTFEEMCPTSASVLGLRSIDGRLWVGMENGLGVFGSDGNIQKLNIPTMANMPINSIRHARNDKDHIWLGTNKGFCYYNAKSNNVEFSVYSNDGLPGNEIVTNGLLLNNKGVLYIATYHGVSIYDLRKETSEKFVPECRLENIYLNGSKISQQRNEFKSSENNFTFELAGLSFKDEESINYEFFMRGLDNDFVASSGKEHRAIYQNLPAGHYEFVYRAKSKDNIWSNSQTYKFVIRKPFYATWWFITIMVLTTIACLIWLFKMREKRLRERNEQLENTVRERTAEIQQQKDDIELKNEELEAQREEITAQRNLATQQRDEIAQREKEIMDSIYYAKRIQTAIMPAANVINSVLENFILFRPRDIVSGDFYYFKQIGPYAIIVAADCTGHGVPGACMSMLGSAYINEIVTSHQDALNSGEILDLLRESVIESLNQTGRVDEAKDGMDIALCILNLETRELEFSGAFNPMYIVRNGEISEYEADRMPIGIHDSINVSFSTHNVQMQEGDIVYIFSDGYASQFGGKHGRKIMTSRFKKLLQEISGNPISEQGKILNTKIEAWMGSDYDQVDDILVIGFKIK